MAPFRILMPTAAQLPLVVSIPHTGTHLPDEVARRLASDRMRAQPMTDWHLHRLYDFLPALGATVLHATWSRFVVDLNRAPENRPLYPGRFETGLVPLETFDGEAVWVSPPTTAEIEARRSAVHAPYHAKLRELVEEARARFGRVVLIDCHSVASRANRLHGELREHFYLGDRDGETCGPWLMEVVERELVARGYRVSRNRPYKGGYITDHYGRLPDVEALQIEMAQRVYMDEADPAGGVDHPNFARARSDLGGVFAALAAALTPEKKR